MLHPLAYAENVDNTGANLGTILVMAGAIVGAGLLAFGPILLAWSRKHRAAEAIVGFAILWGIATAGVSVYTTLGHSKWSHEQNLRVMSGYYDPADKSDAPKIPWALLGGLAVVYGGLLLVASRRSR